MPPIPPTARDAFAADHGLRPARWSGRNLGRMLRATGERPDRVAGMRAILGRLGMGDDPRWPAVGGVWDHGEMWARRGGPWGRCGVPWCVVGHPYRILDEERALLAEMARFGGLLVAVDDRPGYYGHGTHHVRVELVEYRRPFASPPATAVTRAAGRRAAAAFLEELGGPYAAAILARRRGRAAVEAAKGDGFLVSRGRGDGARLAYHEYCRRERLPYVAVLVHRSYATLRLDMDPCSPCGECRLSTAAIGRIRAWFAAAPGLRRDAWLCAAGSGCTAYGVPIAAAGTVARQLADLAMESRRAFNDRADDLEPVRVDDEEEIDP